jgi:hypothetical protein
MRLKVAASICLLVSLLPASHAQTLDNQGQVRAAIQNKYHPTQATADYTDIVTAGDVITLLKSGLVMYDVRRPISRSGNVAYHDSKLNAGGMTKLFLTGNHGPDSAIPAREFVSGEKCWLVGITIHEDGLYLTFLSDSIQDVRYMGSIKFPLDKKQPFPAPDLLMAQIGEVISGAPLQQQAQAPAPAPLPPTQLSAAPAATPAPAPPPPIAPPPPPADQPPPTISLGQTRATVLASFGQPTRVVKLGTKEIDYYKDMKVTYLNDKVSDVQ